MPSSPTLASIAILLLTNGRLQFDNWLSYLIFIKNCISQMSPLYVQLHVGKSKKRFCPDTDRIMMRTKQWLTLWPLKIQDEATFCVLNLTQQTSLQAHSLGCEKHCFLSITLVTLKALIKESPSSIRWPLLPALTVIHSTLQGSLLTRDSG